MSIEMGGGTIVSFTAGASLATAQYKFVKVDGTGTNVILTAAATDIPIGVLQNNPASGEAAAVMVVGVSKVSADAALTRGTLIGTSADGQADAKVAGTDTTEYVVGHVIVPAGAANELATAVINCASPHRAA